jgi:O-methyltransferase involved in polyketide biosynthesis
MAGKEDLSVTALYTAGTWAWGKLPNAELFASKDTQRVFDATNLFLSGARLVRKDVPHLREGLIQRHLIIDALVNEMRPAHVLELAAGLSRRGVTVSGADPRVTYTEVDRAPVLARKRALLERTDAGRAALARSNLRFHAAELKDDALAPFVTAPRGAPLLVIAEGLFMYLDAPAQRALWTRIRRLFDDRPGLFVFDLVPTIEQPRPGVLGRGLDVLMKRFTRGVTFTRDERTRHDLADELRTIGFTVELLDPREVHARFQLPHADVTTQQLVFACRS